MLRRRLHREEVDETDDAIVLALSVRTMDPEIAANYLADIADGIVDAIYVLLGTAVCYGIDIQPIWDIVHEANMKKTGGGKRIDGKVLKPHGWVPPDVKREILRQLEP